MQKLKIILFCDGRPGHEKQSYGVINALKKIIEVDVSEVKVYQTSFWLNIIKYIRFFFPFHKNEVYNQPDLIIGTGSSTHIPILLCKKSTQSPAVVCMRPSILLRKRFDLCFVPMHDCLKNSDNIFQTTGPPNMSQISGSHDALKGLILIGGENQASKPWDSGKVVADIKTIIQYSDIKKWTITTSPRTPIEIEEELELIENISFISFRNTEKGWIDKQYSINKTVWVTADSMSMVYEALSAGCNVGILPVSWKKNNNKYTQSINYLKMSKRIVTLDQLLEGDAEWENKFPLAEAEKCAEEIIRRWWPENLL